MDGMNIVCEPVRASARFPSPGCRAPPRVMKKAVAILAPLMDARKRRTGVTTGEGQMVIATRQGRRPLHRQETLVRRRAALHGYERTYLA